MKPKKIIVLVLLLVVLGYILFPKSIGFIERMTLTTGEEVTTIGEYRECLGVILSEKEGDITYFRCIGIPLGKKTI